MKLMAYDMSRPLKFIQSGHFSSGIGWQHLPSTRKADTEILVGTKNAISLEVMGEPVTLSVGNALCVFPGESMVGTSPTPQNAEFTWLHFVNQSPLSQIDTYPQDFEQSTSLILPRVFKFNDPNRILALTAQLLDATHTSENNLVSANYFVSFFISELAQDYFQGIHQSSYDEGIVNRVKEWIRANINTDLKVKDIASQFNINKDYMARLFKRVTGTTIKTYINQSKINLARYLLLTSDLSVAEIAQRCFFYDYKYFFRLFKKETSLTPLKYRNTFTNTFLNNPNVDPGYDVGKVVALLEKGIKKSTLY